MIEGLGAQNRAIEGDTVIIQLLAPASWPAIASNLMIIGGKQQSKITNETAIESRVIDVERGGDASAMETDQAPRGVSSNPSTIETKKESPKRDHVIVCESFKDESESSESEQFTEQGLVKELDEDEEDPCNFNDDEVLDSSSEDSYEKALEEKKKESV